MNQNSLNVQGNGVSNDDAHEIGIMCPEKPLLIEIEPALGCNLRCIMCHVPILEEKCQFLDIEALEEGTRNLDNLHVIIGSEYEPTIHPEFEKLLGLCIQRNWKVDFLTNGKNLHKIDPMLWADVNFHVLNFSFDGFSKQSFERVRKGGSYERIKENIEKYSAIARDSGCYTAINSTLLRTNLDETVDLVNMWDKLDFDLVRLLVVQARSPNPSILSESLFPVLQSFKEKLDEVAATIARNQMRIGVRTSYFGSPEFKVPAGANLHEATVFSKNPNFRHVPGVRQSLLRGINPNMSFPCKSPLVYARIRWDGQIDLCNKRNFVIGSIYDSTFNSIWQGAIANALRKNIFETSAICENCGYFKFCINFQFLDLSEAEAHVAQGLLAHQEVATFFGKNIEN